MNPVPSPTSDPTGRRSWPAVRCAIAAVSMLLAGEPAPAVDIETLVMPGPVVAGHADIESECTQCHQPFQKTGQNRLCLECHEDVAADLAAKEGFHSHAVTGDEIECRQCHTEHQGRDADVVGLARESFDHSKTDFALEGRHRNTRCEGCHPAEKAFRDAPHDCIDCHQKDDPHSGGLGESCADCHSTSAWQEGEFDHGETKFPLEGAHREVDCALCHPGARYEGTPQDCQSCHRLNDSHRGRFGPRCGECHGLDDWKRTEFEHERETGFRLVGRHDEIRCQDCHTGVLFEEELEQDCVSCHRADDDHRGRNGSQCGDCHDSRSWSKTQFDHDAKTDFPLRGAHRNTSCELCHKGVLGKESLETSCNACHAGGDPHRGRLGEDCARCHQEESWTAKVAFDHDLTHFPLLGLHALAPCEECHVGGTYRDTKDACSACHTDEFHTKRLGDDCARCHNPNGWRLWRFDHDQDTAFALHGEHTDLDCHACHSQPARGQVKASTRCLTCHARDDAHSGRFGRRCESCHVESSWEEVRR